MIIFCLFLQFFIYFTIQVDILNVKPEWQKELKYINYFEFWWKSNALLFNKHDTEMIFGILYAAICFWIIECIIIYNLPKAILGLRKLWKGEYAGQDKLSDLIRATVYVDEAKPMEIFKVLNHISDHKSFKLIRLKERL